jgi:deoxyadenosine/deoxycytidine kinase
MTVLFDRYRHIVIEGPIGVGKTSLAKKMAEKLRGEVLLEQPDENPFLAKFYKDASRYALPAQLFFLFQRVNQLRSLAQRDFFETLMVSDFLIDKDRLFASITLDEEELKLYRQIYDNQRPHAPTPDLVIYLQAPTETLIERVHKRGIGYEQGISASYLKELSETYSRYFYHYDEAPLLIVNTQHLNPIDNEEDFNLLVRQIETMRGKREFFNRAA